MLIRKNGLIVHYPFSEKITIFKCPAQAYTQTNTYHIYLSAENLSFLLSEAKSKQIFYFL